MPTTQPLSNSVSNVADRVALSADSALHTTQAVTNKAFDKLSGKVESLRQSAGPLVDRASARAEQAGLYIKDQPIKSMLVAHNTLDVRIDTTFPLAQAADAHRALEGRKSTGKYLLAI